MVTSKCRKKHENIGIAISFDLAKMVCGIAAARVGHALNSGECIPDGSGFEQPNRLNTGNGNGPTPNSIDGIPDGRWF